MRIFIVVLGLIYCAGASMASSVLVGSSDCQAVAAASPLTASAEPGVLRKASIDGAALVNSRDGAAIDAEHETQPVIFSKRVRDCD